MTRLRAAATLGLLSAIAIACSGTSSSSFGDAGNPDGCPSARPATGAACTVSGLACEYGCNVKATCDGKKWTVIELAVPCPADAGGSSDGATTCSGSGDCPSQLSCSPGGAPSGCGTCAQPQNPCAIDSDCALIGDAAPPKPMVCGPGGPCTCGAGGRSGSCIPACQGPSDCDPDQACAPSGHCVPKPCSSDAECPSPASVDYACSPAGTCAVKSCKTSADCGLHFCVNGACYPKAGQCVPPAA